MVVNDDRNLVAWVRCVRSLKQQEARTKEKDFACSTVVHWKRRRRRGVATSHPSRQMKPRRPREVRVRPRSAFLDWKPEVFLTLDEMLAPARVQSDLDVALDCVSFSVFDGMDSLGGEAPDSLWQMRGGAQWADLFDDGDMSGTPWCDDGGNGGGNGGNAIVMPRGGAGGAAATARKRKEKEPNKSQRKRDKRFDFVKELLNVMGASSGAALWTEVAKLVVKAQGLQTERVERNIRDDDQQVQPKPPVEVKVKPKTKPQPVAGVPMVKQSFYSSSFRGMAKQGWDEGEKSEAKLGAGKRPRLLKSPWGAIALHKEVLADLTLGKAPSGGVCVVTLEELDELRTLASLHKLDTKMVLLVWDLDTVSGVKVDALPELSNTVWATFDGGVRLVWSVMLRDGQVVVKTSLPEVVVKELAESSIAALVAQKWITFRVTVGREFLSKARWDEIRRSACKIFSQCVDGIDCSAGRWREEVVGGRIRLTALVKFKEEDAAQVTACSGRAGFFLLRLAAMGEVLLRTPPVWQIKVTGESDEDYFGRVFGQAVAARAAVALRGGGGNALGLVGGTIVAAPVRAMFALFGAPRTWNPPVIDGVLKEAGWTMVTNLQAPRSAGQGFLFTAARPQDEQQKDAWVYKVGGVEVSVRPWVRAPTFVSKVTPLKAGAPRWIVPFRVESEQPPPQPPPQKETQGTQLDDPNGSQDAAGQGDDISMEEGSRKVGRGEEVVASGKKQKVGEAKAEVPKEVLVIKHPKFLGPNQVQLTDLGGAGDCGWRCAAYLHAVHNGTDPRQAASVNDCLVKSLRALVAKVLENTIDVWGGKWAPEPSPNAAHDAGSPPKTVQEVLEHIKTRPQRWASWIEFFGMARQLKADFILFQFENKKWTPHYISCKPGKMAAVVHVLALRDGHFFAVEAKLFKSQWKLKPEGDDAVTFTARGGVPSSMTSAMARALKPASSVGTTRRTKASGGSAQSGGGVRGSFVKLALKPAKSSKTVLVASDGREDGSSDTEGAEGVYCLHDCYRCVCGWKQPHAAASAKDAKAKGIWWIIRRHWLECQGCLPPKATKAQHSLWTSAASRIGHAKTRVESARKWMVWKEEMQRERPEAARFICTPDFDVKDQYFYLKNGSSAVATRVYCRVCHVAKKPCDMKCDPCMGVEGAVRTPTRVSWMAAIRGGMKPLKCWVRPEERAVTHFRDWRAAVVKAWPALHGQVCKPDWDSVRWENLKGRTGRQRKVKCAWCGRFQILDLMKKCFCPSTTLAHWDKASWRKKINKLKVNKKNKM